jgi:hypothetical protein
MSQELAGWQGLSQVFNLGQLPLNFVIDKYYQQNRSSKTQPFNVHYHTNSNTRIYQHPQLQAATAERLDLPCSSEPYAIFNTPTRASPKATAAHTIPTHQRLNTRLCLSLELHQGGKDASHHTSTFRSIMFTHHVCYVDPRGNPPNPGSSADVHVPELLVRRQDFTCFCPSFVSLRLDPKQLQLLLHALFHALLRRLSRRPTIGLLLTYFSPPTWLTLGYKIGGFMPTDCVTSQLVEGRGSLAVPCQALHLKTWLLSVAGLGDGQSHVRFDPLWLVHLAYFLVMLYEIIAVSFLPRAIDRRIEREEQKKQREDEEKGGKDEKEQSRTEWEIERGVAGGVDAWKAREKAHMDEEQLLD